jgi:hypothetical protein
MFSPSLTPLSSLHTHTRHLKQGFWSSLIEALQSNSSKKEGEGEKRRLLDFQQSEPSPYLCDIQIPHHPKVKRFEVVLYHLTGRNQSQIRDFLYICLKKQFLKVHAT